MSDHLTDLQLVDHVLAGSTHDSMVRLHLEHCALCKSRLRDFAALEGELADLPTDISPSRDLWKEIAARINADGTRRPATLKRRARVSAWMLRAAALLAAFGAGVWYGGDDRVAPSAATVMQTDVGVVTPADVQFAGTRYIETLAAFGPGQTAQDVVQTQAAVYASLGGVARELMRLAPDHTWPAAVVQAADAAREQNDSAGRGRF